MLNPEGIPIGANGTEAAPDPNAALRFEDLTIDDDLSLIDRVVRYVRSGIALQRLVHVKMLAETANSVGTLSTIHTLVPLLPQLAADSESIIRQHLVSQLLPLSLTCMFGDDKKFNLEDKSSIKNRVYNEDGYKIVTNTILNHINNLITDPDMDVRKATSDILATLALYIKPDDVPSMILPIPLRLARDGNIRVGGAIKLHAEKEDNGVDELRITACNLLGDIATLDPDQVSPLVVARYITPAIISLCENNSFRVRRASVQALPRIVNGSTIADAHRNLLPCFARMSEDEMYRVRKSAGECLVDMSRSLMLLPTCAASTELSDTDLEEEGEKRSSFSSMDRNELKEAMRELRRRTLIPICTHLLKDSNKLVKHGMMQFLGPFIASFYPLEGGLDDSKEDDGIINLLGKSDKDVSVGGMGTQFFPHANGMVSRLNPSNVSSVITKEPSPTEPPSTDSMEYFESRLPIFLEKYHNDAKSLAHILNHRDKHPVSQNDAIAVDRYLLPSYVDLATIHTGDENIDAEMRVYCAYSLPAVVLLLGKSGWDKSLRDCFLALTIGWDGKSVENDGSETIQPVPLPVKRCLASSFHSLCHMLGPYSLKATSEIKAKKRDLLSIFEMQFLRDTDDTVRLNVIRNLPSFLALLSHSKRSKFLPILYEIITSDAMLASKRKNALNPILLNWRQRDMIAQILPNLIMLYKPRQIRQYLWPILKVLLADSVNLVRENAEWSLPVLFRRYELKNCQNELDDTNSPSLSTEATRFSVEACDEILVHLKLTLLDNKALASTKANSLSSCGAFSKRQGYCRVLAATALALRLNSKDRRRKPLDGSLSSHPFYNLNSDEYRHIYRLLKEYLLPPGVVMRDDKVTNVRLTLLKTLRIVPPEIRDHGEVSIVLNTLEEEVQTWEGGGGQYLNGGGPDSPSRPSSASHATENTTDKNSSGLITSKNIASISIEHRSVRREEDSSTLASI